MSNVPSTLGNEQPSAFPGSPRSLAERVGETALRPLRFVGFWAAVAMPFLYLPLLYDGFQGEEAVVFAVLLVANLAGLVLGHGYSRSSESA
ncbi:MAG: hypothetical protein ABEJ04_02655 [Halobacteriaceae archaeon]